MTSPWLKAVILENAAISDADLLEVAQAEAASSGKKAKATALVAIPLSEAEQATAGLSDEWVQCSGITLATNVPDLLNCGK